MAWSRVQDEQRPASKNSANLDARRKQKKRPKTTWRRTMEEELKAAGLTCGTAARRAQDRGVGRDLVRALCATWHEEDKQVSKMNAYRSYMCNLHPHK